MFCTKCGKESHDGDKFCWNCGTPLRTEEPPSAEETEEVTEAVEDSIETAPAEATEASDVATDVDGDWEDVDEAPMAPTQTMPTVTPPAPDGYPAQAPSQPQVSYPQYPQSPQASQYGVDMGAQQPSTASAPVPWYMTMPARLGMVAVGVVLICSGTMKMCSGLGIGDKGGSDKPKVTVTQPKDDKDDIDVTDGGFGSPTDGGDVIDGGDDHDVIITDGNDTIITDDKDVVITQDGSGTSGDRYGSWAAECTDGDGNPTGYAISELKGWQLETLCQEEELTWNPSSKSWDGDDYSLVVYDLNHDALDDEEIAELGKGGDQDDIVYQIRSGACANVKEAYDRFVSSVMVNEDSDASDTMVVGVAYGPSMERFLVMVTYRKAVNEATITFIPRKAVEDGGFDKWYAALSGTDMGTYGNSIEEVFERFAGRELGSNH